MAASMPSALACRRCDARRDRKPPSVAFTKQYGALGRASSTQVAAGTRQQGLLTKSTAEGVSISLKGKPLLTTKENLLGRTLRTVVVVAIAGILASCGGDPQSNMPGTLTFVARGKVRAVEGDVTLVNAVLPLQLAVGDDVTFEFAFRSDAIDEAPADPSHGIYAVEFISMTIGVNSTITRIAPNLGHIHVTNNGPQFGISYSVSNSSARLPCTGSECIDRQLALQLTGAPTSYLATDALLTEPPIITAFGIGQYDRIMLLTLTLPSGSTFTTAHVWSTLETIVKQ